MNYLLFGSESYYCASGGANDYVDQSDDLDYLTTLAKTMSEKGYKKIQMLG